MVREFEAEGSKEDFEKAFKKVAREKPEGEAGRGCEALARSGVARQACGFPGDVQKFRGIHAPEVPRAKAY